MAVECPEGSVTVKAQDSGYSLMYNDATITNEWQKFEYTCTVKEDYASKENAYLGFRWASQNADYANYKFYYKNFVFTAPTE